MRDRPLRRDNNRYERTPLDCRFATRRDLWILRRADDDIVEGNRIHRERAIRPARRVNDDIVWVDGDVAFEVAAVSRRTADH